jgi:beta-lactamase regulating signal transducer with metallopeptidase domain/peptidoglycan hydrolase CwlO-like protein
VNREERQAVSTSPWIVLAVDLYLAVALLLLLRLAVGLVLGHRLVRSSVQVQDLRLLNRLSSRAHGLRQNLARLVRESSLVSVPVTIGIVAPRILLPSTWREWDEVVLDAVLTHELSHVRRHDSLSQFSSLLHRAIFWFSPFAWWLNHQIVELAEQASDEAALSGGAERNDYARTLLHFFAGLQAEPRRVYWQGVAMANTGKAERRLEKVLAWKGTSAMSIKKSVVTTLIALGLPAVYVGAAAHPVFDSQGSQNAGAQQNQTSPTVGNPGLPAAPASAPENPNLPTAPAGGGVSHSGPTPLEPSGPLAPVTPGAPAAPAPAVSSAEGASRKFSTDLFGDDEAQRFVIVSGKSDGFTMSGTSEDARHVDRLRTRIPGDFIWFQRDEKSYIIRDQATVNRARQLWAPQEELGKKQEELGKRQEALGKQQEELGLRMQQIRVKVPDVSAELDKVKAELQQLGPGATVGQVGDLQAEIGELQAKVGEVQANAGEQQEKLGQQMRALGDQQGKLGQQQGELGRQQGELAQKANKAMKELLDGAIKNGIAQPEPLEPGGASL